MPHFVAGEYANFCPTKFSRIAAVDNHKFCLDVARLLAITKRPSIMSCPMHNLGENQFALKACFLLRIGS